MPITPPSAWTRTNSPPGDEFDGRLDDFAFWNRRLTDRQILDLFHGASLDVSIPGDTNHDGRVDAADAGVLAGHCGRRAF